MLAHTLRQLGCYLWLLLSLVILYSSYNLINTVSVPQSALPPGCCKAFLSTQLVLLSAARTPTMELPLSTIHYGQIHSCSLRGFLCKDTILFLICFTEKKFANILCILSKPSRAKKGIMYSCNVPPALNSSGEELQQRINKEQPTALCQPLLSWETMRRLNKEIKHIGPGTFKYLNATFHNKSY